jgi:hypothetical protein
MWPSSGRSFYFFGLTGIHTSGFFFRCFFFFRGIARSNSVRGLHVCIFNFTGEILKPSLLGNSYGIGLYVWLDGRSNDWFDCGLHVQDWVDCRLTVG